MLKKTFVDIGVFGDVIVSRRANTIGNTFRSVVFCQHFMSERLDLAPRHTQVDLVVEDCCRR